MLTDRWVRGLPALALLLVVAVLAAEPRIEDALRDGALARIGAAGERRPAVPEDVRLVVAGRDLVVQAEADLEPGDLRAITSSLADLPGLRSFRAETLDPLALSPFRFSLSGDRGGVSVSGGVPTRSARSRVRERAAALARGGPVRDELRLATGAPEGFEAALDALLSWAERAGGARFSASLEDRALSLRAEPDGSDAYRALRAPPSLPPGFTLERLDVLPPSMSPFAWSAVRDPDGIALAGGVPAGAEARLAEDARAAAGDGRVDDRTEAARGLPEGVDFGAASALALRALGEMQNGRATLEGDRLDIVGDAVGRDRADEIAAAVRRDLPAGLRLGTLAVAAVPASPFGAGARREGGSVTLSGFVPSAADKVAIAAFAAERFLGDVVKDRLRVADGAPPGFLPALRTGLGRLAELAGGELRLRERSLRLEGRSLYRQHAARLERVLPTELPDGWSADVSVRHDPDRVLEAGLCSDLLGDVLRRTPIPFEDGEAALPPSAKPAADALADVARRCGGARVTVVHRLPPGPDPDAARALAARRAAAIAAVLAEAGAAARLSAAGEGRLAENPGARDPGRTDFVVTN